MNKVLFVLVASLRYIPRRHLNSEDIPSDLTNLFVKNEEGEMVPYSSFMKLKKTQGPNEITRYNLYNSAAINGLPAKGYTTGDAIAAIKEVAEKSLPRGYDIAWEGLSYDEANRGNEAFYIFLVVLLFVYLVLAAQYESFVLPFAVLLSLANRNFWFIRYAQIDVCQ
ncbi:MAG: efflux RND transporter permease subunit [Bacteroidia bacterium]